MEQEDKEAELKAETDNKDYMADDFQKKKRQGMRKDPENM